MRPFAYQIIKAITLSTGSHVFLSGDSCYGSCDVALNQAKELEVDLLIHYGHSDMIKEYEVPVLFVHAEIDIDTVAMIDAAESEIKKWERIGIVTTVQHVHQINDIQLELESRGFVTFVSTEGGKTPFPGQILGCYYIGAEDIADQVDGFLYIGGGKFHPIGLIMSTGKPVVIADPFSAKISMLSERDLMLIAKKRMASIEATKQAKNLGILVSSKPGQKDLKIALKLENKFRKKKVNAVIIYLNEVRAEHLNNFVEPEAFINTACPRLSIDGIEGVNRPILTVNEALVVLGEKKWEDLWSKCYLRT
jgi:2-(3-amino-3-carboxypropyl)histidine synthase